MTTKSGRSRRPDQAIYVPKHMRRKNEDITFVDDITPSDEKEKIRNPLPELRKSVSVENEEKSKIETMTGEKPDGRSQKVLLDESYICDARVPVDSNRETDYCKNEFLMNNRVVLSTLLREKVENISCEILKSAYSILRSSNNQLQQMKCNSPQMIINKQKSVLVLPEIAAKLVNIAMENAMEILKVIRKSNIESEYEKPCSKLDILPKENNHWVEGKESNSCSCLLSLKRNDTHKFESNEMSEWDESPGENKLSINLLTELLPEETIKKDHLIINDSINIDLLVTDNRDNKTIEGNVAETLPTSKKKKKKKLKQKTVNLPISNKISREKEKVSISSNRKQKNKNNFEPNKKSENIVNIGSENKSIAHHQKVVHPCPGKNNLASLNEELEDWESSWTEDGECVNEQMLKELSFLSKDAAEVDEVIDYLDFKPKEIELDAGEFGHIVELYDISSNTRTRDLYAALIAAGIEDYTITWVDDSHALVVFASQGAAHNALKLQSPVLRMRQVINGSPQSRIKARDFKDTLLPYKKRPAFTAMVARNLVAGSLGIKTSVTVEQRRKERDILRKAKEEKKMKAKQKIDIWENGD